MNTPKHPQALTAITAPSGDGEGLREAAQAYIEALQKEAMGEEVVDTDKRHCAWLEALAAHPTPQGGPVRSVEEDGPCYYCGKPTNSFAGNPGQWPLRFPHADEPGKVKCHHTQCVLERLEVQQPTPGVSGPSSALELQILTLGEEWPGLFERGQTINADKVISRLMDIAVAQPSEAQGWMPIVKHPGYLFEGMLVAAQYPGMDTWSDPYFVIPQHDGSFTRWPHEFPPTHYLADFQYPANDNQKG